MTELKFGQVVKIEGKNFRIIEGGLEETTTPASWEDFEDADIFIIRETNEPLIFVDSKLISLQDGGYFEDDDDVPALRHLGNGIQGLLKLPQLKLSPDVAVQVNMTVTGSTRAPSQPQEVRPGRYVLNGQRWTVREDGTAVSQYGAVASQSTVRQHIAHAQYEGEVPAQPQHQAGQTVTVHGKQYLLCQTPQGLGAVEVATGRLVDAQTTQRYLPQAQ